MSGQVSRGSAGEFQADEQAGVPHPPSHSFKHRELSRAHIGSGPSRGFNLGITSIEYKTYWVI